MFRKMRRMPQAMSRAEMTELLKTENRGVLSVNGDDGYPYGVPLNHFYNEEDGKIYFHGAKFGHRVDAVRRDPKVSYCVYGGDRQKEGDWAYYVQSVIVFGKMELIEDEAVIAKICRMLCKKFPCSDEYIESEIRKDTPNTLLMAIDVEEMTGKLVHEA